MQVTRNNLADSQQLFTQFSSQFGGAQGPLWNSVGALMDRGAAGTGSIPLDNLYSVLKDSALEMMRAAAQSALGPLEANAARIPEIIAACPKTLTTTMPELRILGSQEGDGGVHRQVYCDSLYMISTSPPKLCTLLMPPGAPCVFTLNSLTCRTNAYSNSRFCLTVMRMSGQGQCYAP